MWQALSVVTDWYNSLTTIGRNIGGDLAKLARDFPEYKLPEKANSKMLGVVELGAFDKSKNAIPRGTVSAIPVFPASEKPKAMQDKFIPHARILVSISSLPIIFSNPSTGSIFIRETK
jgi:hypothetical protein